jgi:hypothetical protein
METQRTVTILLPDDADLRATLKAFCTVQNAVSEVAKVHSTAASRCVPLSCSA